MLAIDATNVYVTCYGTYGGTDGSIVKLPVGGGSPVTLVANQPNPIGVAVNATNIFWLNNAFGSTTGTLNSAPLSGAPITTFVTGMTYPDKLTLSGSFLYWTNVIPTRAR